MYIWAQGISRMHIKDWDFPKWNISSGFIYGLLAFWVGICEQWSGEYIFDTLKSTWFFSEEVLFCWCFVYNWLRDHRITGSCDSRVHCFCCLIWKPSSFQLSRIFEWNKQTKHNKTQPTKKPPQTKNPSKPKKAHKPQHFLFAYLCINTENALSPSTTSHLCRGLNSREVWIYWITTPQGFHLRRFTGRHCQTTPITS